MGAIKYCYHSAVIIQARGRGRGAALPLLPDARAAIIEALHHAPLPVTNRAAPPNPERQQAHFASLKTEGIHIADAAALVGETVAKVEANWRKRGWVRLGPDCLELAPVLRFIKGAVKVGGQGMNDLQKHRARKAKVEADEAEGRVLSRETVDRDMLLIVHTLKRALRTLPGTLASACPGTTPKQMQAVRAAVDEALTETHAALVAERGEEPQPSAQPAVDEVLAAL